MAKAEAQGPKCNFKLKAYKCSYNAYLDANPSVKKWAEPNPANHQVSALVFE